jgi:copper chaperone CopZ
MVITRVRLASPVLVAALTLAWVGVCMGIDYTWNRHLWEATARDAGAPADTPLSLRINHLCCSGCFADVREALKKVAWLADETMSVRERLLTQEQAEGAVRALDYSGWVDVSVPDLTRVDFVEIDRVLREQGMVASEMQLRFPKTAHIRFVAQVRHLCCGMCVDAAQRIKELSRAQQFGRLRWLDSVTASHRNKEVVFHARYEESIDVAELLGALDAIGLPAFSLRVNFEDAVPVPAGQS